MNMMKVTAGGCKQHIGELRKENIGFFFLCKLGEVFLSGTHPDL